MAKFSVTNVEALDGSTRTSQVAASADPGPANPWLVGFSMILVAAAAVVMWVFYHIHKPTIIKFSTGYVPYTGVVFAAAALERFLEPLSEYLLPDNGVKAAAADSKSDAQKAAADPSVGTATVQSKVSDAATNQATADRRRTERAILFWMIATFFGLFISGTFGFFLLQSLSTTPVNSFLDLIVTGLAIGAGTKPLHDLITSVQAKAASPGSG
jgi:hypothetical protein